MFSSLHLVQNTIIIDIINIIDPNDKSPLFHNPVNKSCKGNPAKESCVENPAKIKPCKRNHVKKNLAKAPDILFMTAIIRLKHTKANQLPVRHNVFIVPYTRF